MINHSIDGKKNHHDWENHHWLFQSSIQHRTIQIQVVILSSKAYYAKSLGFNGLSLVLLGQLHITFNTTLKNAKGSVHISILSISYRKHHIGHNPYIYICIIYCIHIYIYILHRDIYIYIYIHMCFFIYIYGQSGIIGISSLIRMCDVSPRLITSITFGNYWARSFAYNKSQWCSSFFGHTICGKKHSQAQKIIPL